MKLGIILDILIGLLGHLISKITPRKLHKKSRHDFRIRDIVGCVCKRINEYTSHKTNPEGVRSVQENQEDIRDSGFLLKVEFQTCL